MALDSYSPCPCGSGKKFKWCCQPIHEDVARAMRLEQEGQHESALRAMDEVVAKHADQSGGLGPQGPARSTSSKSSTNRRPRCRRRSNRIRATPSDIISRADFGTSKAKSPGPSSCFAGRPSITPSNPNRSCPTCTG